MKKPYQISKADAKASAVLQRFTQANGQFLLPLVELITDARLAVDTVIDQIGRQTIETGHGRTLGGLGLAAGVHLRVPQQNHGATIRRAAV